MRHQSQEQLRVTRIGIAESVIKGLIRRGDVKKAIEICEQNKISPKRFGELARMANAE